MKKTAKMLLSSIVLGAFALFVYSVIKDEMLLAPACLFTALGIGYFVREEFVR